MIETEILDKILKDGILRIEIEKKLLNDMTEFVRQECVRVESSMLKIKHEVLEVVEQVDWWKKKERKARIRLTEISKSFHKCQEDDIRKAYETARDIQIQIAVLREKEEHLNGRRLELEQQYVRMQQAVEKSETIVSQIGLLSSNLKNLQALIKMHEK